MAPLPLQVPGPGARMERAGDLGLQLLRLDEEGLIKLHLQFTMPPASRSASTLREADATFNGITCLNGSRSRIDALAALSGLPTRYGH